MESQQQPQPWFIEKRKTLSNAVAHPELVKSPGHIVRLFDTLVSVGATDYTLRFPEIVEQYHIAMYEAIDFERMAEKLNQSSAIHKCGTQFTPGDLGIMFISGAVACYQDYETSMGLMQDVEGQLPDREIGRALVMIADTISYIRDSFQLNWKDPMNTLLDNYIKGMEEVYYSMFIKTPDQAARALEECYGRRVNSRNMRTFEIIANALMSFEEREREAALRIRDTQAREQNENAASLSHLLVYDSDINGTLKQDIKKATTSKRIQREVQCILNCGIDFDRFAKAIHPAAKAKDIDEILNKLLNSELNRVLKGYFGDGTHVYSVVRTHEESDLLIEHFKLPLQGILSFVRDTAAIYFQRAGRKPDLAQNTAALIPSRLKVLNMRADSTFETRADDPFAQTG